MSRRYSHEQKTPPSQGASGWLSTLGFGAYVLAGLGVLAALVVVLAFCVPHGGST